MTPREPIVVFDIETVPDSDHHVTDDMPKVLFHQVVAISYLRANVVDGVDGRYFALDLLRTGGDVTSSEKDLLAGFWHFIVKSKPRLVTFNGRGFDLPVAKYRAMKYGIAAPWFAQGESKWENYSGRYSVDWHCDLMDALADFGASKASKLSEICALLGVPSKLGLDGSLVKSYVEAGRLAEVRNYCETDVLATYLVFLRFALFRGELTPTGFQASVANLKAHLANERANRPHLGEFADAWVAAAG
ncbi:MAG TPA: 3'-5' exonuclease [Rhizomicrobium sp.]|jgi:predicted PolB exonuclease-like 3'-5' exonuclease